MTLAVPHRVERDGSRVAVLLADNPSALWLVVGAGAAPADIWAELERGFCDRELSRSLSMSERELASRMAREFFAAAEADDPELRYNFTARVPLAIPDWDEVQNRFRLRALAQTRPDISVVIWLADPTKAPVLCGAGIASNGDHPEPWPVRAGLRVLRSLVRCLLHRRPRHVAGGRLWISVGRVLAPGEADTYFGDWWRQAAGKNFRIFQSSGSGLRLGQDASQAPLEAFGSSCDALGAMLENLWPSGLPAAMKAHPDRALWRWLAHSEWARGDKFMLAFQARAVARLLGEMNPESLVLPFEGRAWERLVARLARRHGMRVIGYQHSSLTPRHLALLQPGIGWCHADAPDQVVTCGAITTERLEPFADTAKTTLCPGASLRAQRQPLPPPGKTLLVAISSSLGESRAILQMIHGAASQLEMPIIIRPHPTIPIDELFSRRSWPLSVEVSRGRSLAEDMGRAGFIAYSSSTVALEGLLHDRLPVFLDIRDVLSGDPIDDGEFKLCAASPEDLVRCLRDALAWPAGRLEQARASGRTYAERYLAAPSVERLDRMSAALLP